MLCKTIVGTFADPTNSTANLTLSVEKDRPAISLDTIFVDGADAKFVLLSPAAQPELSANLSVQLYPTGLMTFVGGAAKQVTYRAVNLLLPVATRSLIDGGASLFDDSCISWFSTAFWEDVLYGTGEFYDEFVLEVERGKLSKVIIAEANKTLERVE